jgi:protocatechuate 3,4-dioxygenase beta subunit
LPASPYNIKIFYRAKKRTRFLGLILTAFLCLAQGQPEGSIAGRLTNMVTGAPARKATIVLTRRGPDRFTRSATSDTNGRYSLNGLPPGRYGISALRDGFLPFTYGAKGPNRPGKVLVLGAGQKLTDVNLALEPPAVISGRVLDEEAEPVSGVTVQALHEDFTQGTDQFIPVRSATTNDIGEYRLFGLPPGKFYLMSSQTPVTPGAAPNGLIYGSVFYPSTTDFGAAAALNMAAGGEARDIDLRVARTGSVALRGTVTNLPVGSERTLQVQMSRKDRARVNFGNRSMGGFNANTGQFEFQGLTPGSYAISAWIQDKEKFLYARQDVEVGEVDLNDVRLTLGNGLEIPGKITFSGGAPPDARTCRVWLSRRDFSGPTPSVATDADYSFVLKNVTPGASWSVGLTPVPPGGYIESIALGEEDGLTRPLTIPSGSKGPLTIVLGMHGGTVAGAVRTTGEKPEAVESATVLLVPARKYQGVASYFKTAVSDSEGHYQLRGIAPGAYRLLALEDMEPMAYQNPEFLKKLEDKGKAIGVARDGKATEDLTIEPLP